MSNNTSNDKFVGRDLELTQLKKQYTKKTKNLITIQGRRRIGKSRLITEFAKKYSDVKFWQFEGMAPIDSISAQRQRDAFARQLALTAKLPPMTFEDWSDAFEHLSLHVKSGDIILFDEISWMGSGDPEFVPKLKIWWDKQNAHILLVLCGSVSTWIEENILNSTAFYGRINLKITLEPLSISDSAKIITSIGIQCSSYDMYKLLNITEGVPWYLKQFEPSTTANENIKQLAFSKDGLLVREFNHIFHDLFGKNGTTYKKILNALKDGHKNLSEIKKAIQFSNSGTLSKMVHELSVAGFITKQPLWSFNQKQQGKLLKQSL